MRYLRRFNESKLLDESVIDECKDILLELEDIGIETSVSYYLNYNDINPRNKGLPDWIQIYFSKSGIFSYMDIEEVVERLKRFLSEWGLHIECDPIIRHSTRSRNVSRPFHFFEVPKKITSCELFFNNWNLGKEITTNRKSRIRGKSVNEHYSQSVNEHYLDKYKKREVLLSKSIIAKELVVIKDVLLDLKDSGIKTTVQLITGHGTKGYPNVYINVVSNDKSDFSEDDKNSVMSCLSHIKSYMLSNDWTLFYEREEGMSSVIIFKREKNV